MELYIIVSNYNVWRVHWASIPKKVDCEYVLIADTDSYNKILLRKDEQFFKEMYTCPRFKDKGGLDYDSLDAIVASLIKKYPNYVPVIVTINEDDMLTCALLREKYHLRGDKPADVKRFTDKVIMKKLLAENDELKNHIPGFILFDKAKFIHDPESYINYIIETIPFPIFAKPQNESDSISSAKITNREELKTWLENNKDSEKEFELDEFIQGDLYHCTSIVINHKIQHVFASAYLNTLWDVANFRCFGSIVLPEGNPIRDSIIQFNDKVLGVLKPNNCITFQEVFIDSKGKITFLEIAKRSGGRIISEMYDHYCGLNMRSIDYQLNMGIINIHPKEITSYYACLEIVVSDDVHETDFVEFLKKYNFKSEIHIIGMNRRSLDNVLVLELLLSNPDYKQLETDFFQMKNRSQFE